MGFGHFGPFPTIKKGHFGPSEKTLQLLVEDPSAILFGAFNFDIFDNMIFLKAIKLMRILIEMIKYEKL